MSENVVRERPLRAVIIVLPLLTAAGALLALLVGSAPAVRVVPVPWTLVLCLVLAPVNALAAHLLLRRKPLAPVATATLGLHVLLFGLLVGQLGGTITNAYLACGALLLIAVAGTVGDYWGQPWAAPRMWVAANAAAWMGLALFGRLDEGAVTMLLPVALAGLLLAALLALQQGVWTRARLELATLRLQDQSRRNALRASTAALQAAERRLGALHGELTASAAAVNEEREQRVRFMNNVGEELRTPLNVIVNFANLLARDGAGAVDERQVDYLERIERAGWHVLEVLDDLLDLARIEEGDAQPDRELVDLESVCEEALAGTRGLVLGKPVQLVRDFPEACPLVYGDSVRLKQALISLLGSAARFTDEGYIALRLRPQDHTVDIVVEDTGANREPARANARPGMVEQPDAALARRRAGVGLGQPLTRHLVERHGGTMTLHSAPGYGSVFSVTLPLPRCEPVYDGALVAALY